MRKSVTSQTEKAFVAYIQGNQSDTVLETVSVYAGGLGGPANTVATTPSTLTPASTTPPVLTPPYLIFTASDPEQLGFDSGLYELQLIACLVTQVDDEMDIDGQDVHRERLEALRDMLEDVSLITTYVNPPTSGPDNRAVKNFTLSGVVYQDDPTKFEDRKLVTDISYYVCACPADS